MNSFDRRSLDVNSLRPGQLPRDFLSFPGSKYWSMAIAQNLWFYRPVEFVLLNLTSWQVAVRSVPRQICPNPSEALHRPLPRLKPENGPFLPPLCQNVPQLPQLSKTHTNILSRFILYAWILFILVSWHPQMKDVPWKGQTKDSCTQNDFLSAIEWSTFQVWQASVRVCGFEFKPRMKIALLPLDRNATS